MRRRDFLRGGCAALGTLGLGASLRQMQWISAAAAAAPAGEYRALVCLFLYGGNDSCNMVVPTDSAGYQRYSTERLQMAVPYDSLLPFDTLIDGRPFGLNPALSPLKPLYDQGRLALMMNVGTLQYPMTREEYRNKSVPRPSQLFSHSDQQMQWQSGIPEAAGNNGWGGRMADLLDHRHNSSQVSMSISLAGNNLFLVGDQVNSFHLKPNGTIALSGVNGREGQARLQAIERLSRAGYSDPIMRAFASVRTSALDTNAAIDAALASAPALPAMPADNRLAAQLGAIARMISVGPQLGLTRQVFFCSMGGWDTHADQDTRHPGLLAGMAEAMAAFQGAIDSLGMAHQVTAFTASDFGRSWNINGTGTDHGWGGHQWVMGGAVQGGCYGQMPELALDGPDDAGRGRFIPTTAVDQYAATLARWLGVADSELRLILPNIGRFEANNTPFLTA